MNFHPKIGWFTHFCLHPSGNDGEYYGSLCYPICQDIDGKKYCEDVCSTKDGLVRVYVGVVLPKIEPSGDNIFELCQDGKCVEAGREDCCFDSHSSAKLFEGPDRPQIGKENYLLRDLEVTDLLIKQGWPLKKPLVARMTKSVEANLPDPVVIYHQLGKNGDIDQEKISITLSPKENRRRYGNLLNGYPTKKIKNDTHKKHW